MTKKQRDLGMAIQQKANGNGNGGVPAASPAATVAAYLKKMESEIARALPKHITPERMTRIALTTIRTNPQLLQCSIPSLMAAVMQASQLGLEPGLIGHCYFVPFNNNKTGQKEVQFIIGYKGMIDLARRSGNIKSISAHEVYENDMIELEYGLEEKLSHVPWFLRKDQRFESGGKIIGAYMIAKFNDGGHYIHYMPVEEIEAHRKRSKASNNGPWVTDYVEMCKKTVVRSGWKWLPISIEQMAAVTRDEAVVGDITEVPDNDSIIDITASQSYTEEMVPEQAEEPQQAEEGQADIEFDEVG